jgi:hypothetical protein
VQHRINTFRKSLRDSLKDRRDELLARARKEKAMSEEYSSEDLAEKEDLFKDVPLGIWIVYIIIRFVLVCRYSINSLVYIQTTCACT